MDVKIIHKREVDKESEREKELAARFIEEYLPKIERLVKSKDGSLEFLIKSHNTGKTKDYEIKIKLISLGKMYESESEEWDFAKAVHSALDKLIRLLEHKFKA